MELFFFLAVGLGLLAVFTIYMMVKEDGALSNFGNKPFFFVRHGGELLIAIGVLLIITGLITRFILRQ